MESRKAKHNDYRACRFLRDVRDLGHAPGRPDLRVRRVRRRAPLAHPASPEAAARSRLPLALLPAAELLVPT